MKSSNLIIDELFSELTTNLLNRWYPKVIDKEAGGYFSNLAYNFELLEQQEKIIVTQSRHIWTLSKSALLLNLDEYINYALHGYKFIYDHFWDKNNTGLYQIRDRYGNKTSAGGWNNEKRTYGNAFGLYGISALYKVVKEKNILNLAERIFNWIDNYCYDKHNKGYFQFLTETNSVIHKNTVKTTQAEDSVEIGYKDQNSSIHLLEAFTEFYSITTNPIVKERLHELLILIRDVIVNPKGYLNLFFSYDWKPVSLSHLDKKTIIENHRLDHGSFGHDYETAFLLLEASYTLGLEDDISTLRIAKNLADHALENGWDNLNGGFYEAGYYFNNEKQCSIIQDTKNWWAQAEALNIYLILSKIFPTEYKYEDAFYKVWEYIKNFIIDKNNGGWFWGGIDKQPDMIKKPKGEIWKCTYHNGRALMNCLSILSIDNDKYRNEFPGLDKKAKEMELFIEHWKDLAKKL